MSAGLFDLSGELLDRTDDVIDITDGPEHVLAAVGRAFHQLLERRSLSNNSLWGIAVGLPGPVEFVTGCSVSPPDMPGWDGYPVRTYFSDLYATPVWVDNDVNLLALGELRAGLARGAENVIYVKIGTGIGAGIIAGERIHRGAQGSAGEIGHIAVPTADDTICQCGNRGCLGALASGSALARDGARAAESGESHYLASRLKENGSVSGEDVAAGAQCGDRTCLQLLQRFGHCVGDVMASLVNFFNPSLILIGTGVTGTGDLLLASVREAVYARSLPLATRNLQIRLASLGDEAGLRGGAAMVMDELFCPERLARWLPAGDPTGQPDLVAS
jgi:glucokinase-like ROK family protein